MVLEQKNDQQDDEDEKKNTTTDIHLQPPFVRADRYRYPLPAGDQTAGIGFTEGRIPEAASLLAFAAQDDR
jgi:hypothetical protein